MTKAKAQPLPEVEVTTQTLSPHNSEDSFALEFAARHSDRLRYVALWGKWLKYDGTCWRIDQTREVYDLSSDLCREFALKVNSKSKKAIASAKTRGNVVALAGEKRKIAATTEQWDRDDFLLNTPGGVVDLRTGEIRGHRADDYMTMITGVAPDPNCLTPLWDEFQKKITKHDLDYIAYKARMYGYCLTGDTTADSFFFNYGTGGNGKTTEMNMVSKILGTYHRRAAIETFLASKHDRHPTELANLRAVRMVTACETEEGRRWNEALIKTLTGGEAAISARYMRQDFFEYMPKFTLVFFGNHKPKIRNVDEAMARRIKLNPYTVNLRKLPGLDENFEAKLEPELPGIFWKLIQGCVQWQKIGLAPPKVVTDGTAEYLAAENTLQRWIDECCDVSDPNASATSKDLFQSWMSWCQANNEWIGSAKDLGLRLIDADFIQGRVGLNSDAGFRGIKIKPVDPEPRRDGGWN
jgi:putative DNA primase/helicase